jgi:hypothetical protein
MILEIAKPEKPVNSAIFFVESGFNLFQDGDKFYLSGEATEQQLLAAYEAHNPSA